jgi:hypothetical protein
MNSGRQEIKSKTNEKTVVNMSDERMRVHEEKLNQYSFLLF